MGRVEETLALLSEARTRSNAVVVAYSGGKDSICVMDLCLRTFDRVEAFFMYLIPGLESVERALSAAEARWGIKVRQYPHWLIGKCLSNGVYCPHRVDELPEWRLQDVYKLAMAETGIPVLATGAKKADSLWRRRQMSTWCTEVLTPLRSWSKHDVLAYLKLRSLPIPSADGRQTASGIDLTEASLLWMHDAWPNDFERLCRVFPYARAVPLRRKWYPKAVAA